MYIVKYQLADRRYAPRYIGVWSTTEQNLVRYNNRLGNTKPEDAQIFPSREQAVWACYLLADDVAVSIVPVLR